MTCVVPGVVATDWRSSRWPTPSLPHSGALSDYRIALYRLDRTRGRR